MTSSNLLSIADQKWNSLPTVVFRGSYRINIFKSKVHKHYSPLPITYFPDPKNTMHTSELSECWS